MPRKKSDQEKFEDREILKKLSARLKTVRKNAGYSSAEKFAVDNGLSRVPYMRYESGKGNPALSTIHKIFKKLDVSFQDFFSEGFD